MLNRKSLIVVVSLLSSSSIVALNNSYAAGAFADHEVGISRRAPSAFPGLSLRGLLVAATAVFSSATYTREEGSKSMGIVSGRELPYVAAGADYAATGGVGPLAVTSYNPLDRSFLETAVGGAGVADHGSSLTAHRSERDAVTAVARSKLRGGIVLDAGNYGRDDLSLTAWPSWVALPGDVRYNKKNTENTKCYYKGDTFYNKPDPWTMDELNGIGRVHAGNDPSTDVGPTSLRVHWTIPTDQTYDDTMFTRASTNINARVLNFHKTIYFRERKGRNKTGGGTTSGKVRDAKCDYTLTRPGNNNRWTVVAPWTISAEGLRDQTENEAYALVNEGSLTAICDSTEEARALMRALYEKLNPGNA